MQNLVQPDDMFGRELTFEELFAKWFNKALQSKIDNGLSDKERVNHILYFPKPPDEFIHKHMLKPKYFFTYEWDLSPILNDMLYDKGYTVESFESKLKDSPIEMLVTWDRNSIRAVNSKNNDIFSASILRDYELDDDEGFISDINKLLDTANEGVLFEKDSDIRCLTLHLNILDKKYFTTEHTCLDTYRYVLHKRYEALLVRNGWKAYYKYNIVHISDDIPEHAVLKMRDNKH